MDSIYRALQSEGFQEHLPEFWLVAWVVTLIAIVISTWVIHSRGSRPHRVVATQAPGIRHIRTQRLSRPLDYLGVGLLAVSLVVYVFFILYRQDLAGYDNDIFTEFVLNGKFYAPPIWPMQGRFFPLGHQEWNLLSLVTAAPTWFFMLPALELLAGVVLLFLVFKEYSVWVSIVVTLVTVTMPAFVHSFFSLAIPERNLIVWILVFVVAANAYSRTRSGLSLGVALVATHVALYYKEPAFILFGSFAGLRLMNAWWTDRRSGRRATTFVMSQALDVGILALCVVFLAWYAIVYLSYRSLSYAEDGSPDSYAALAYYLRADRVLWIFFGVTLVRITFLVFSRKWLDGVWDYLAVGAIGYVAFYVAIGLSGDYYLAPVDVIAVCYLADVVGRLSGGSLRTALAGSLCLAIASQNIYAAPRIIYQRLNFIDGRAHLASFLLAYTQEQSIDGARLHFPLVRQSYTLFYFSCFLRFKDRQIGRAARSQGAAATTFTLTSPLAFSRNNCVDWNPGHKCLHADAPQGGDSIVVLPEDIVSGDMLSEWKGRDELLFQYSSVPASAQMDAYVFRRAK